MEIMMYIIGAIIVSIVVFRLTVGNVIKNKYEDLFVEKNLSVKKIIPLGKKKVYLYNLKKQEDKLVREDYTYARIAKMINNDLEIKAEAGELTIEVPDYSSEAYKFKLIDIISLVTNFNYAQFIFKGDDLFRLYDVESKFKDELKAHALAIVEEITNDIVERIEEGINNPSQ